MGVEDELLIQEVAARYSYSYDSGDADAFAKFFVEDAIFEVIVPTQSRPAVRLLSRAAIREWVAQRYRVTAGTQARHYQSGLLFDELTANIARTRTMLLLTRQGAPDSAPLLQLTGVYHDTWRKTGEGWRLVHRAAHLDRDPGFGSTDVVQST
jgi:ketosteroid isomerase-like protein